MFHIIAYVALLTIIILLAFMYSKLHKRFLDLAADCYEELQESNRAWEQGQEELVESYEMDRLTASEKYQELYIENQLLLAQADIDRGKIFDQETTINFLRVELADVRESAIQLQVVAEFHAQKCLPTLEELFPKHAPKKQ